MSTEDRIRPIVTGTYGDNGMSRALVIHLAERIDTEDWDSRGREDMLMRVCWDWFSGGTTAERVGGKIETELRAVKDESA